jgi:hypothetical protein
MSTFIGKENIAIFFFKLAASIFHIIISVIPHCPNLTINWLLMLVSKPTILFLLSKDYNKIQVKTPKWAV